MYWYHEIIGDVTSHKHVITKEELYNIEDNIAREVCNAYRKKGEIPRDIQKKAATLLSVSFYCLRGNEPLHPNSKSKFKCPKFAVDEYIYHFTRHLITHFTYCDRDKGAWTPYVRFAKGKACRDTIKWLIKQDKEKELLDSIINTLLIHAGKFKGSISSQDKELSSSDDFLCYEDEFFED